jgi:two-component system NarL family sensor kinase
VSEGPEAEASELRDEVERLEVEARRLRSEVESSRLFLAQVMDAEDAARRRIAQLIHDDALQTLLAANQELIEAAPGRAQVMRAHEVVSASIARLREAVLSLHPVTLEQGGLQHALDAIARQAERQGSLTVLMEIDPQAVGVDDELVLAISRELLANAARHSRAANVSLSVLPGTDEGTILLEVHDDGQGIEPGAREGALAAGHIGLASVTQRVEASGGRFELRSEPGAGTTARVVLGAPGD